MSFVENKSNYLEIDVTASVVDDRVVDLTVSEDDDVVVVDGAGFLIGASRAVFLLPADSSFCSSKDICFVCVDSSESVLDEWLPSVVDELAIKVAISLRISRFDSSSSLSRECMLSFWFSKLSKAFSMSFKAASSSSTSTKKKTYTFV